LNCSVIIPTRDRAEMLARCLDALAQARAPGGGFEVIVVDNGSRDDTVRRVEAEMARGRLPLRMIAEAREGPSSARNCGVAAAAGALVIFLDDDALVDGGWLEAFARAAAGHPRALMQGRVLPGFPGGRPVWLTDALAAFLGRVDEGPAPGLLRGTMNSANMAVPRDLFVELGGFRSDLGPGGAGMGEDTEFGLRAAARGFPARYVPEAVVDHVIPPERTTRRAVLRRLYGSGLCQPLIERFEESTPRLALHLARMAARRGFDALFARDGAEQMTALCDLAQRAGRARGILRQRRARREARP
jgi:GT2 family glycosyltransferase